MDLQLFLSQRLRQLQERAEMIPKYVDRPEMFLGKKHMNMDMLPKILREIEETEAAIKGIKNWKAAEKRDRAKTDKIPMQKKEYKEIMQCVRHKIDENVAGQLPKIDDLAKEFFLSKTVLTTQFKAAFGQSVYNYYLVKKMDLAARLLLESGYNISEIADKVGYLDVNAFGVTFKRYYKVSPMAFKKRKAQDKNKASMEIPAGL